MADVNISKFRTSVNRPGSAPASPGFAVSEGQDPVHPSGSSNFVTYSGATDNVDLGEFGLDAGFITLDTTPTNTPTAQGTIFWDADDETVDVILNGYTMKIGEDLFYPVKNQTGSTIAKGTAVRFNGTLGASGRLLIAPFIANGSVPSSRFMGVTAEEILDGEDGKVLYFGRIRGINTDSFNEGDILYASTTVAGGYQTAIPLPPNNIVEVAAVISKSPTVGTIFVRPTLGSNINTDEGVKITSVADKNLLQYQSGTALWENKTLAQVLGGTSSQFVKGDGSLDSTSYQPLLTNPVTGTGTTNYLPKFTGSTTIGNSTLQETSGNLGLGVTPSAWGIYKAYQVGWGSIASYDGADTAIFSNTYFDGGTWRYIGTGPASQYRQLNSIHSWHTAPSGTAGNAISFTQAMTLTSGGNLLVGTTTDNGARLQVSGTGNTAMSVGGNGYSVFTGSAFSYTPNNIGFSLGYNRSGGNGESTIVWGAPAAGFNFEIASVTSNVITPRMTITTSGNVLIGTTTDNGAKLQVSGASTFSGIVNLSTAIQFRYNGVFRGQIIDYNSYGGGSDFSPFFTSETSLAFGVNGNATKALNLASTGAATFSSSVTAARFISSTSSSYTNDFLNFNIGTVGQSIGLRFGYDGSTYNKAAIYFISKSANGVGDLIFAANNSESSANVSTSDERMRITSSGNVGIGTTTPGARLDVTTSFGSQLIVGFSNNPDNFYDANNHFFRTAFGVSNTLSMISGNVLIGTTTSGSSKLRIVGLPTSSSGLSSGDIWNDGGTLKIV